MSPKKQYTISEEHKKQYAGVYMLKIMINTPRSFPVMLDGDDQDLQPIFEWLMMKGYVEIRNNERYVPTEKGREVLKRFMERYTDYLRVFDIYCAVDMARGEFAFARYFDFECDPDWQNFLDDDRWDDLRLAVAEFKKLDAAEIVFMNFINEGRFGTDKTGWQFDLLLGTAWDEILNICNTAITVDEIGYEDEQGKVSGEAVIKDVIRQGAELNIKLKKKERELEDKYKEDIDDGEDEPEEDYAVEPVIIEEYPVNYYYAYRDPFYISPVWLALWLL